MLAPRCSLRTAIRPCSSFGARVSHGKVRRRRFASTAAGNAPSPPTQQQGLAALGGLTGELDRIAPRFEIDARDITILQEPAEFYSVLKDKIANAKRRIYISTLYVGKTEHELIATIQTALRQNPRLTVSLLTDCLRGTREEPEPSSASLLAPLVAEFGAARVAVRMFHTPNLVGVRKALLPRRINEGWGLQHMKLYGVDDELVLSGANLSADYFTNRQDRYHLFRSAPLADFYARVHDAVASISFDVQPPADGRPAGFELRWPADAPCASPLVDARAYVRHASALLAPLVAPPARPPAPASAGDPARTLVYPLFQLAPLLPPAASTELPALRALLHRLAAGPLAPTRWLFTAGYFNMTPGVRDMLLASLAAAPAKASAAAPRPHGTVLTAHPHANGFHGSAGISGMLPAAYTLLAGRFERHVAARGLASRLALREWRRGSVGAPGGWTYHAKGLWVWVAGDSGDGDGGDGSGKAEGEGGGPAVTLVGSSNYTARSHALDLEAGALVVTGDAGLRARLGAEAGHLLEHAGPAVDAGEFARPERRVGWRVRVALWIVGVVGGAL